MSMHDQVSDFCARIGADPLLVQGAGGNVSWKTEDTLWIKASGTWLKDARAKDIFVPVDLSHLRAALAAGRYDATPRTLSSGGLRPSIETVLHALLPQPVVVHIHAIHALAWMVRPDPWPAIAAKLPPRWQPCYVPYRKPGAELAAVVRDVVAGHPGTQLVFMGNHGIVMAGDSLSQVGDILDDVARSLAIHPSSSETRWVPDHIQVDPQRVLWPVSDPVIQSLDLSASGLARMSDAWALYPDHVVFLGDRPICHASVDEAVTRCRSEPSLGSGQPHFIQDVGVFALGDLSPGCMAQLRCYADVMIRQTPDQALQALTMDDVAALLNWDAERYRQQLNQTP
jgi:rhamnose utilization protein RhaD (predicted bifunctional aldolase and dehydrogenase)